MMNNDMALGVTIVSHHIKVSEYCFSLKDNKYQQKLLVKNQIKVK